MFISDLNHIEAVESNQVIGGGYGWYDKYDDDDYGKKKKFKNVAVAIAVAGDRKYYDD
ncbi:hypothetical protein ACE1AT_01570 [Pelatocladus sp. BLCC-F211]|uniref:hypothetical protein n=1 Tax=Pelatocladus sp. BLCC-F211 TaxID=3342752 RepID=UPI0035BAF741